MSGLRLKGVVSPASVRGTQSELAIVAQRQAQASVPGTKDSFQATPKRVLTTLKPGATGPEVHGIQLKLKLLGLMSEKDVKSGPGIYGPRTHAAVRRFQERLGLPVTGFADPGTRAALMGAERKNHETTAPAVEALEISRMAQTLTDEDDDVATAVDRAS